jgi:DNA-binding transcriptional ArsR family regulator
MSQAQSVFSALADPTRRAILEAIRTGGETAGEIARRFDVSWPAISRHLRVLKAAGLVWETRDGRTRYYEVNHEAVAVALGWLTQFRAGPARQSFTPFTAPSASGREYSS